MIVKVIILAERQIDKIRRGRPRGSPNKITQDIREAIKQAFHSVGGSQYLAWVAKRRPDVFLTLVGKVVPAEAQVSVLHAYIGLPAGTLPVRVEQRDPIPLAAPAPPPALPAPIDAEYVDITPQHASSDWVDL